FYQRPDDGDWADRLASAVEDYLSPQHRDNPLQGCPLPAIVGDTTLSEGEQEALATQLEAMVRAFRTGQHDARPHAPQDAALGSIALMVGGLILARALSGTPLSDAVLKAGRVYGRAAIEEMSRE